MNCFSALIEVHSIVFIHSIPILRPIRTFCKIKPHQFLLRWPSATLRNQWGGNRCNRRPMPKERTPSEQSPRSLAHPRERTHTLIQIHIHTHTHTVSSSKERKLINIQNKNKSLKRTLAASLVLALFTRQRQRRCWRGSTFLHTHTHKLTCTS